MQKRKTTLVPFLFTIFKGLAGMLSFGLLLGILPSCGSKTEAPPPLIFPEPAEMTSTGQSVTINNQWVIGISTKGIESEAHYLQNELKKIGLEIPIKNQEKGSHNTLFISLSKNGSLSEQPEGYSLSCQGKEVAMEASTPQGIFYAIQSFLQLIPQQNRIAPQANVILPGVKIQDAPRFAWRGMMMDVSRHFRSKEEVKKFLDLMALHKMNRFHWHLVDGIGWRIQIDQFPELTKKGAWRLSKEIKRPWEDYQVCEANDPRPHEGGFYTKEDIKEVVAYAAQRHIMVIPEIEMPGHSTTAIACYPNLKCPTAATGTGEYCAGNEEVYDFLEKVLSEVFELFPSPYIHIGADEVGKGNWEKCPLCQKRKKEKKLTDEKALQSYFVQRMEAFIHNKGKKVIGWHEIMEGKGVPQRTTIMWWGGGIEGGHKAAIKGHEVIMAPGSHCYFDHYQGTAPQEPQAWGGNTGLRKVYDFEPLPDTTKQTVKTHILGCQANIWTETIYDMAHFEYMALPRMTALSEVVWSPCEKRNWNHFQEKLDHAFSLFESLGYNYAQSSGTPSLGITVNPEGTEAKVVLSNEMDFYPIHYTLDGTDPTPDSPIFKNTIHITQPSHLKAFSFRNGKPFGYKLDVPHLLNKAAQAKPHYNTMYNTNYSGGGEKGLIDQKRGTKRGDDPHWQGFQKDNMDVSFEFSSPKPIESVTPRFFQHVGTTNVIFPTEVEVKISLDGKSYQTAGKVKVEPSLSRDALIKEVEIKFPKTEVKSIRVIAHNPGTLPKENPRKNQVAWIFSDEIIIE